MTLKELPYQDGINWTELEGKPAIVNLPDLTVGASVLSAEMIASGTAT